MALQCQKLENLHDLFLLIKEDLINNLDEKTARSEISKIQTGLVRYTLPGWGFLIKLTGRLTHQEVSQGVEFMKQISLLQTNNALEVQAQVFQIFGKQVKPTTRRVYKSAVMKLVEFGRAQPNWPTRICKMDGRAPLIHGHNAPLGPKYSLKEAQFTPQLKAELEHITYCWANVRSKPLKGESITIYERGIRNLLGWLHLYKGIPLNELSLLKILPPEALTHPEDLEKAMSIAKEYITWLQEERRSKPHGISLALYTFFHLAEYANYVRNSSLSNVS